MTAADMLTAKTPKAAITNIKYQNSPVAILPSTEEGGMVILRQVLSFDLDQTRGKRARRPGLASLSADPRWAADP
jgi:hypothetical protein